MSGFSSTVPTNNVLSLWYVSISLFFRDEGEDYVDITEPEEDYERVIKMEKKKKSKSKTKTKTS